MRNLLNGIVLKIPLPPQKKAKQANKLKKNAKSRTDLELGTV